MSKHANPARIGAFVVVGALLFVALVLVLGSGALFQRTYPFVLYFDGSVNGLRAGAPVKFKGVEIGSVRRIDLPLERSSIDLPIAVLIELDRHHLQRVGGNAAFIDTLVLQEEIDKGLRAQLESESFVTGILYVALKYDPESTVVAHGPLDGVPEIPTLPTQFEAMQSAAMEILRELRRVDFVGLVDELRRAIQGIADLGRSQELRGAIAKVDETLGRMQTLAATLEREVAPTAESLRGVAREAQELETQLARALVGAHETMEAIKGLAASLERQVGPTLASVQQSSVGFQSLTGELETTLRATRTLVDADAPLAVRMRSAVEEIERTARAARSLIEYLERNPGALVRGQSDEENP